ncbi:DEAD/DEAH box helicase [Corynebacterium sp. CCUG 65737]|uniref:DEAD/DEAH box helicase n=1 Tax=Corynebacterium sp. CCUG 65737 TaxID=2823889 RepID=UPI00210BBB2F|nr:DEAD/DEAH box helicase [Corynebacterium sp. CCUG 65737]
MSDQQPTFAELGVAAEIVEALGESGIERVFSIQELTLPLALAGRDLIGQARTGMGKTFAFGVPLLDRVFDDAAIEELDGTPRALVITPTRELAVQVSEDLTLAASKTPVRLTTIYGGRPYDEQLNALEAGVDVVVGTPGRLLDLHERGDLVLDRVAILVLDEADEMLDLGFLPDIQRLWGALSQPLQTMLFSATMPAPILKLAREMMNKPVHIRAESADSSQLHDTTKQVVFVSHKMDKPKVVARVLQADGRGRTIIFTRTKRTAAEVAEDVARRGFAVGSVHGDLGQSARERSLEAFRKGDVEILVATDVAARGIDVDDVTHVINYQTPDDPMTYVHRIGRTGRAGRTGTAVTLVGFDETGKWKIISDELGLDMPEPPSWFSTSPELFDALSIPEDAASSVGPAREVHGIPKRSGGEGQKQRSRSRSGSGSRSRSGRRR